MRYFYLILVLTFGLLFKISFAIADEPLPFETHAEREARVNPSRPSSRVSVIPMIGASLWDGRWRDYISNKVSFGLGLDIPLSSYLSTEVEAGYGRYNISYSSYDHDFNQYDFGSTLKLYWFKGGLLRP